MTAREELLDFQQWMKEVDKFVDSLCGLSHRDLPDIDYRGLWECGEVPEDAAEEALAQAGFDF